MISSDHVSAPKRGERRVKRIAWTAFTSLASRAVSLSCSFLTIPLAVTYLGQERYGYWIAMSSAVALLSFADFGVGFGLMNSVARALGNEDLCAARLAISNTFLVLAAIAVSFLSLLAAAYFVLDWQQIFAAPTVRMGLECGRTAVLMAAIYFLSLPFTTVQRVQFAHQEGYVTNLWQGLGVIFSVGGLLLAIYFKGGLTILALGFTLGPFIALVCNWAFYFLKSRGDLSPRWSDWQPQLARQICSEGSLFLILQLAGIVVFSVDNLILLHFFGPEEVTQYSLMAKLFQIGPILAAVWFAPIWPAYAEAVTRGDIGWVRKTIRTTTVLSIAAAAGVGIVLSFFMQPLVKLWTGVTVEPSWSLLLAFFLSSLLVVGTSSISAFLNAVSCFRPQVVLAASLSIVSLGLALVLPRLLGTAGVVWSTVLGYMAIVVPAYCVIVPRLFEKHEHRAAGSHSAI